MKIGENRHNGRKAAIIPLLHLHVTIVLTSLRGAIGVGEGVFVAPPSAGSFHDRPEQWSNIVTTGSLPNVWHPYSQASTEPRYLVK